MGGDRILMRSRPAGIVRPLPVVNAQDLRNGVRSCCRCPPLAKGDQFLLRTVRPGVKEALWVEARLVKETRHGRVLVAVPWSEGGGAGASLVEVEQSALQPWKEELVQTKFTTSPDLVALTETYETGTEAESAAEPSSVQVLARSVKLLAEEVAALKDK